MDVESIKKSIREQNQLLETIEKTYNQMEYDLRLTEAELILSQQKILENFPGKSSVSEVGDDLNSTYAKLEKQIIELEKSSSKNENSNVNQAEILRQLQLLDQKLDKITKNTSLQAKLDGQLEKIKQMEELLSISSD